MVSSKSKQLRSNLIERISIISQSINGYSKDNPTNSLSQYYTLIDESLILLNRLITNSKVGFSGEGFDRTNMVLDEINSLLELPSPELHVVRSTISKLADLFSNIPNYAVGARDIQHSINDMAVSLSMALEDDWYKNNLKKINYNDWLDSQSLIDSLRKDLREIRNNTSHSESIKETSFRKLLDRMNKQFGDLFNQTNNDAKNYLEETKTQFEFFNNELKSFRKQAKDVLEAFGDSSITSSYALYAKEEKTSADILRALALAISLLTVAAAVRGTSYMLDKGFDLPTQLATKVPLIVLLVLPAIYAFRESSKHRAMSIKYRKAYLELSALGPYIANFPVEKQLELKFELAKRFFGREEVDHKHDFKDDLPILETLNDTLRTVAEVLKSKST